MNKKRKIVVAVLGISVLLGTGAFAAGTQEQAAESSEVMEITWLGSLNQGYEHPIPPDDSMIEQLIEEKFNVEIKVLPVNVAERDKAMLFFAEGGKADFLEPWDRPMFEDLVDQGMLRDFPGEWLEQYMPETMERVTGFFKAIGFDEKTMNAALTYDGRNYMIPTSYNWDSMYPPYGLVARRDWLENVGITKLPETLPELEAMLGKFTHDDPDGNGIDDTYGTDETRLFPYVFGAYGIAFDSYYVRDGKVVYTNLLPEYKEALGVIRDWVGLGLIDPEFSTDNRTLQRAKWAQGKFGMLLDHPWWMLDGRGDAGVLKILTSVDPDATFAFLPPIKGPTGLSGNRNTWPRLFYPNFGADANDAKVQKIMEIKEAQAADSQGFGRMVQYGTEGIHYVIVDGKFSTVEGMGPAELNQAGIGGWFGRYSHTFEDDVWQMSDSDRQIYLDWAFTLTSSFSGVTFYYSGVNEVAQRRSEDVTTISKEYFFNVVTGKKDLESDWDEYVRQLQAMGVGEIVKEYQKLYDDYQTKLAR